MKYVIGLGKDAFGLYRNGPAFSFNLEQYEIIGVITYDYDHYSPTKGALAKDKLKGGYVMLTGLIALRLDKRRIEALMRTPKKRGPKKKLGVGKKHQIYITDEGYAWLKKIGHGNARFGLSLLLDAKDKFENMNHE